jgi:hypothetical protein
MHRLAPARLSYHVNKHLTNRRWRIARLRYIYAYMSVSEPSQRERTTWTLGYENRRWDDHIINDDWIPVIILIIVSRVTSLRMARLKAIFHSDWHRIFGFMECGEAEYIWIWGCIASTVENSDDKRAEQWVGCKLVRKRDVLTNIYESDAEKPGNYLVCRDGKPLQLSQLESCVI